MSRGSALPTLCRSVAVGEFGHCEKKAVSIPTEEVQRYTLGFDMVLIFHVNAPQFNTDW